MKTIMRSLTGALLIAAAVIVTGRTESAAQEVRLSDIRVQQPLETVYASAPCQRARESQRHIADRRYLINPNTLVQNLNTPMEQSEHVVLAGLRDSVTVISPSGEGTATYREVRVIRSWKGPHRGGDILTFGWPGGDVDCAPLGPDSPWFVEVPDKDDWGFPQGGPYV